MLGLCIDGVLGCEMRGKVDGKVAASREQPIRDAVQYLGVIKYENTIYTYKLPLRQLMWVHFHRSTNKDAETCCHGQKTQARW